MSIDVCLALSGVDLQNIEDNSKLLARVNLLLEQSNPDVLAYAAQLEDDTYIQEYLTGCPNEVCKHPA